MRLRLSAVSSLLVLALVGLLYGTSGASSTQSYKPSVKLVCVAPPCGSYPPQNAWHGAYYAERTNLPSNAPVVITVTYPNGKPYPVSQYNHPGQLYGVQGNVERTDEYGQLPDFKWAAVNSDGSVDPQGVYRLAFRFKTNGKVWTAHAHLRMGMLP